MHARWIWIVLLAAAAALGGCNSPQAEQPVASRPRSVVTMRVAPQDLPVVVNAVGRLLPNREVVLSTQVSGIVQSHRAEIGHSVQVDETVVTLRPRDYQLALNEARANLSAARARLASAKNSFTRAGQLLPERVITPETYDKIEAEYKAALAAVAQAEAVVDINQSRLDKTVIKAPFGGLVTRRLVETGQNLDAGDPVMAIADMQSMRVKIHINEEDYVQLDKDDPVSIRVEAFPDRIFDGVVDRIGVKADAQTNTFEVEILLANPALLLKAGLTASVGLKVDEIKNAVIIPQDSILYREGRTKVFVVTDQDTAAARQVELGRAKGSSVRILAGLAAGERLVTTGGQYLKDGDRVMVVEP